MRINLTTSVVKGPFEEDYVTRQNTAFQQIISVGPAMERDFRLLGIRTVAQLAHQTPRKMCDKLCRLTGQRQDICCLDVFCAAVAQARNLQLPVEQSQWWYWSRKRKAANARGEK